jgi:hypothetical protein
MQKEDKKRHHHTKMKTKRHQYPPCMMAVIVSLGNIKE